MNDLRSAVRSLRATPLVTGVAALSLTLGIGASIVIFSLTNSLLLRKLPVRDPSALVLVTDATVPGVRAYALGVWESFRRFVDVFDGTLAWSPTDFNLVPRGEAQIVSGAWVSGWYFETLGISPLLGRVLAESDDRRNGGVDGPVAERHPGPKPAPPARRSATRFDSTLRGIVRRYLPCSTVRRIRFEAVLGRLPALAVLDARGPNPSLGRLNGPEPGSHRPRPERRAAQRPERSAPS